METSRLGGGRMDYKVTNYITGEVDIEFQLSRSEDWDLIEQSKEWKALCCKVDEIENSEKGIRVFLDGKLILSYEKPAKEVKG